VSWQFRLGGALSPLNGGGGCFAAWHEAGMDDQTRQDSRLISFYRLIPGARAPMRADRAAAGTMPTRAFRFCEAMRTASAFGWYLFPPITFTVMWDGGADVLWTYHGADAWYPLKSAQFPGFAEHFDKVAPDAIKGFS